MARTWLSVRVELLGGGGEELWPWPGRIFAVGPSHTFMDLARAINDAFARWDLSHLSMFTLEDGRVITDEDTGAELAAAAAGPILAPLDIESVKVARTVELGAEFQFTYDLGDNWTHRCLVDGHKVDPLEVLGIRPDAPQAYWGWGTIPDQYGRRWDGDDGEGRPPRRPSQPHPMLTHEWPARDQAPALDLSEVRAAIATKDARRFLDAVTGRDIGEVLQQAGAGLPMALQQQPDRTEPVAISVINRLTLRAGPGGEVYDENATDAAMVGDDLAIDVEDEPDRWLRIHRTGSRAGWQDMANFAERQRDAVLRERLERSIEGRGAFRRFRDLIHEEGIAEQWYAFSTDRQLGRAREFLADEGIRIGPRPAVPG